MIILFVAKTTDTVPICSSTFRKIYGAFAQISLALADMSNRQTNTIQARQEVRWSLTAVEDFYALTILTFKFIHGFTTTTKFFISSRIFMFIFQTTLMKILNGTEKAIQLSSDTRASSEPGQEGDQCRSTNSMYFFAEKSVQIHESVYFWRTGAHFGEETSPETKIHLFRLILVYFLVKKIFY